MPRSSSLDNCLCAAICKFGDWFGAAVFKFGDWLSAPVFKLGDWLGPLVFKFGQLIVRYDLQIRTIVCVLRSSSLVMGLVRIRFHDATTLGLHLQHFDIGVFNVKIGQKTRVFNRGQNFSAFCPFVSY